ncbi:MAG: hypothetical protein V3S61_02135, partial [Dehalococcoidales bacterium]
LTIALAGPALVAAQPNWDDKGLKGYIGQAGNSNNAFMELWEKDSETWDINPDGAWGKLKYSLTGTTFDFHFNGHGLEPLTEYALIYYPDPWPGADLIIFDTATTNDGGNITIKGSYEIPYLPTNEDENDGAKIWLVLSGDVGDGEMAGWNPGEYLFEYDLIAFNADTIETATADATGSNPGNPNKPDKPEKSNNGKGNNK